MESYSQGAGVANTAVATMGVDEVDLHLTTRDEHAAHSYITDVYIPHDLVRHDRVPLDFKLTYLHSSRLTLGHLVYGADSELVVPPMQECYHLNLTLNGQTMVTQGGESASTEGGMSGVLFNPTESFNVRWSPEAVQYAIKLPRKSVETHLEKLINRKVDSPIDFNLSVDLTQDVGRSLLATVDFFRNELSRPEGLRSSPLARDQIESLILTQVLLAVPNQYSNLLRAPDKTVRGARMQTAMEYIQNNPEKLLSTADIAAAVCISERALQLGFREAFGMSPSTAVRMVRLDRVRAELMAGGGRLSVTTVAMKWGFYHVGRFAQLYKDRFGELPSRTGLDSGH